MRTKKRINGPKWRGQTAKAQSAEGLAEVACATNRLWRKNHLSYDHTGPLVDSRQNCPPQNRAGP